METTSTAEMLEATGTKFRKFKCDPEFGNTSGLIAHYGFDARMITNTMIITGRADPRKFAAVVVLSTHKIDVKNRIRELLGVKRPRFATVEETEAVTGMTVGGIGPFGLPDDLPIFVDGLVMGVEEILVGSGDLNSKLIVPPSALKLLPNVRVAPGIGVYAKS